MKGIALGQYYPADSIMHRLDPRTKVIGAVVYGVPVQQSAVIRTAPAFGAVFDIPLKDSAADRAAKHPCADLHHGVYGNSEYLLDHRCRCRPAFPMEVYHHLYLF